MRVVIVIESHDGRRHTEPHDARAMADTNRIQKELREIASDTASGVTVAQHGDSLVHMKGTIRGASSSIDDSKTSTVFASLSLARPSWDVLRGVSLAWDVD